MLSLDSAIHLTPLRLQIRGGLSYLKFRNLCGLKASRILKEIGPKTQNSLSKDRVLFAGLAIPFHTNHENNSILSKAP